LVPADGADQGGVVSTTNPFSRPVVAALEQARILGVRSGTEHRFTAVWVVVVTGRVFARSWSDSPGGWYRAFAAEPNGALQLPGGREIRVRARKTRGERLLDAIDEAYAEKYPTPASRKWVRGFRQPRRRGTTMEFVPRR
jgi:hypothetical protein